MEEEVARWCAGIDGVGETLESETLFVELADQIGEIFDSPDRPIQFPESIAFAQEFNGPECRLKKLCLERST
jgi:hypothetical protein